MATASARMVITGEDRTKKAFQSVQTSLGNLNKSFGSLKGGIGAMLGIGGLGAFVSQMTATADKIGKVSSKLGISTDALQKFRFGAEQSGIQVNTFDMAIQRMTRRVAEARNGTGEAKKALKEMGISLRDSSGNAKTTEQIFLEVADVMKGMTNQSDKVRLSFKLFDSEGVALVNMMQQGKEAILGYGDELERYGGIIDNDAIKASENFNDALNKLQKSSAVVFTPLIIGLNRVMEFTTNWIDYMQGLQVGPDPFKVMGKSTEELGKRLRFLNRLGEKAFEAQKQALAVDKSRLQEFKEMLGFKSKEYQLQETIGTTISEINAIEAELTRRGKTSTKQTEKKAEWMGITMEMQKEFSAKLTQQIGSEKEVQKLIKSQQSEHEKLKKVIEEEVDEYIKQEEILAKTSKTWVAIIHGIDGSKHKVSGLTKVQAEALAEANRLARAQELYEGAVKETEEAQDKLNEKQEKQRKAIESSNQFAQDFMSAVKGSSAQATRFFNALKLDLKQTKDGLRLAFDTNWMAIIGRFAMSSKAFQQTAGKMFDMVGTAIDNVLGGLIDTNDTAEEMARRAKEIDSEIESMTGSISGFSTKIRNASEEMQTLANIEKTYQERVAKANELDAEHLKYYAQIEKDLGILAYRVGVLRSATQAFASSATQFLDAVATEGFTELQKRFFAMVKGFERGVQKSYGTIIEEANKIIDSTSINPEQQKKAFQELQKYMQMYVASDYRGIINQKMRPEDIANRYGLTLEQLQAPVKGMVDEIQGILDKGGLGQLTGDTFRRITARYLPVIQTAISGMDTKISAFNEAVKAKTEAEKMLPEALKGLTIMIKDVIQTEFQAGKSKEQLRIDLDALSQTFQGLNIDVTKLKDFVDTLVAPVSGDLGGLVKRYGIGGMVKRYPYGGSISGPSHSGGGVNAELEGGEYVMRKSAVDRYGSAFMNAVNTGQLGSGNQLPIQVNIYDGTGQQISEYDSALRVEINQRANRYHEFPAVAM